MWDEKPGEEMVAYAAVQARAYMGERARAYMGERASALELTPREAIVLFRAYYRAYFKGVLNELTYRAAERKRRTTWRQMARV